MKIKSLHINEFKFFPKSKPIILDQKNLLVYGENGSGKSTIYWALYTLFESSIKSNAAEFQKYFIRNKKDCLVNIYAKGNKTSFVQVELENGDKYRISHKINKILTDPVINKKAQEINLASDFINYRMLYRFHDLKHSKEFEIFDFLLSEIFMYLDISGQDSKKYWEDVLKGPNKVYNKTGQYVYPTAKEGIGSKEYKTFKLKFDKFNDWLKKLLIDIENEANIYLKNDFEIDIKIKFVFHPAELAITPLVPTINLPKIYIEVPQYYGTKNKIKKPHTFLNEAKLTALALSIRFGILKKRLAFADLKILVLDDFLVSLDMSYRDKILDIILTKLAADYQLVLLTHDYNFFEFTKDKIAKLNRELKSDGKAEIDWKKLEMYEFKIGKRLIPFITNSKTNLEKAKKYFYQKTIDLPASANYMRKATEQFCDEFLPLHEKYNASFNKLDLANLISKTPAEAIRKGMALPLFLKLDSLRQFILNPQSHYNKQTPPLFKDELQKAILTLEKLEKLTGIKI